MNYPAAELRGIKMNFYLINPDAKHRGILLIKYAHMGLTNGFTVTSKSPER
jgi:hypothetical protein